MLFFIATIGSINLFGIVVGYQYFNEFAPSEWQTNLGTGWLAFDAWNIVPYTIYFWVVGDWRYLVAWGAFCHFVFSIVAYCKIPESPKWLYSKKRWAECYDVVKYMGKFNKVRVLPTASKLILSKDMFLDSLGARLDRDIEESKSGQEKESSW